MLQMLSYHIDKNFHNMLFHYDNVIQSFLSFSIATKQKGVRNPSAPLFFVLVSIVFN